MKKQVTMPLAISLVAVFFVVALSLGLILVNRSDRPPPMDPHQMEKMASSGHPMPAMPPQLMAQGQHGLPHGAGRPLDQMGMRPAMPGGPDARPGPSGMGMRPGMPGGPGGMPGQPGMRPGMPGGPGGMAGPPGMRPGMSGGPGGMAGRLGMPSQPGGIPQGVVVSPDGTVTGLPPGVKVTPSKGTADRGTPEGKGIPEGKKDNDSSSAKKK